MLFCIVSSASVTNFFPTVVQTLKFGRVESLLLTAPPYVLAVITAFINAWHADRTGERYFHITLPLYIAVIAFIIAAATTTTGPRYLAMMLMPAGIYTGKHFPSSTNLLSNSFPCSAMLANIAASLRRLRCSLRLDKQLHAPSPSKARCSPGSHQCRFQYLLHLRQLHVSEECWSKIWYVFFHFTSNGITRSKPPLWCFSWNCLESNPWSTDISFFRLLTDTPCALQW